MLRRGKSTETAVTVKAELEAEIEFLRAALIEAKVENAHLKGEIEELKHINRSLQSQPASPQPVRRSATASLSFSFSKCKSRENSLVVGYVGGAEGSLTEETAGKPAAATSAAAAPATESRPASSSAPPAPTPAASAGQPVENEADRATIRAILSRHKTFQGFTPTQISNCVSRMVCHEFCVCDTVIREGDTEDDLFYIVRSGEYSASVKARGDEQVAKYAEGGTFGELALRYGSPRKATVVCGAAGVLWALDRATFQQCRPGTGG